MPWIRIIEPKSELRTLSIREKMSAEQLISQQIRTPLPSEHLAKINFTPLSAFHFFTDGVNQSFFTNSKSRFGILIDRKRYNGRDVIFRASQSNTVSDDIFKTPMSEDDFAANLEKERFGKINEQQVRAYVKQAYQKRLDESEDKNDALIPWTEGLFRHKFSDINGVLVHNNEDSLRQGYAFAKIVENITKERIKFYGWDQNNHRFFEVDRSSIKQDLGFAQQNSYNDVIDKKTLGVIKEFHSYLGRENQRS